MKLVSKSGILILLIWAGITQQACGQEQSKTVKQKPQLLSESEWKKKLSQEEYEVLREKGTELPYSGEYEDHWESGVYVCKGCGAELFNSATKFDAGCGWPSFYQSINKTDIQEIEDFSHGMHRIEVQCANCGGHLGHVFPDGPKPTGMRYCINSVSLGFRKK
jgi:peptide-methionine (R)-S-oxide reductase